MQFYLNKILVQQKKGISHKNRIYTFLFLYDFPFSISKVIFFETQFIFQFIYSKTALK